MRVFNKKVFILNISGVHEENINFIQTTNISEINLSFWKHALVIISTPNNSQTNVRKNVKFCI